MVERKDAHGGNAVFFFYRVSTDGGRKKTGMVEAQFCLEHGVNHNFVIEEQ